MPEDKTELTDDELRAVLRLGRKDLLQKLTPSERKRAIAIAGKDAAMSDKPPEGNVFQRAQALQDASRASAIVGFISSVKEPLRAGPVPTVLANLARPGGGVEETAKNFVGGAIKGAGKLGLRTAEVLHEKIGSPLSGLVPPGMTRLRSEKSSFRALDKRRKANRQALSFSERYADEIAAEKKKNQRIISLLNLKNEASFLPGTVSRMLLTNPVVADRMATQLGTEIATEYVEFASNPERQAEEDPIAFISSAADLAGVGWTIGKMATVLPDMMRAVRVAASKADEAGDALRASVELRDSARNFDRIAGPGSTEQEKQAAKLRERFEELGSKLEDSGHSKGQQVSPIPETSPPRRKGRLKDGTEVLLPDQPIAASGPTPVAREIRMGVGTRLANSLAGAVTAGYIFNRDDERLFSPMGLFAGAVGGFVFVRYLESPAVRHAIKEIFKGSTDRRLLRSRRVPKIGMASFQEVFDSLISPILSNKPRKFGRKQAGRRKGLETLAGGATGAMAGFVPKDDETSAMAAAGGGVVGALMGSRHANTAIHSIMGGRNIVRPSARQTYQRWIRRDGGLPSAVARWLNGENKTKMLAASFEATAAAGEFAKFRKWEREFAMEVIKGERDWASLKSMSLDLHEAALRVRNSWDRQSIEIIEEGLATGSMAETVKGRYGTYLPRIPQKYYAEDESMEFVANQVRRHGDSLHQMSDRNYLKERHEKPLLRKIERLKKQRDKLQERFVKSVEPNEKAEIGGKINSIEDEIAEREEYVEKFIRWAEENAVDDVPTLTRERYMVTQSDLFVARYQNAISAMPEYTLSREITDAINTGEDAVAALSGRRVGQFYGPGGRDHVSHAGTMYRRLPDEKRYGSLANRFVEESIAYDIEGLHDMAANGAKWMNQLTALFKTSKVTWNPATLMRNWYGQIPLNDWGGLGPIEGMLKSGGKVADAPWDRGKPAYIEAAIDFNQKGGSGGWWQEASRSGAIGGEWVGQEITPLRVAMEQGEGLWGATSKFLEHTLNKPLDQMTRFHEATEQYHKLALFIHGRRNGMTAAQAAKHAQRWGLDYSDVPKLISVVRRAPWGAPFISFSYKALPRAIESMVAVRNPRQMLRFWKYPLAMAAMSEAAAHKHGFRTEEEKQFLPSLWRTVKNALFLGTGGIVGEGIDYQEYMPDWAGAQQVLSPWVDSLDRLQFFDLTWMTPWGDLGEFGKGTFGQILNDAGVTSKWPRSLEPGNPLLHTLMAMGGVDLFTGNPIVSPDRQDEPIHGPAEWVNFVGRTWFPALSPGIGHSAQKIKKSGATGSAIGLLGGATIGARVPGGPVTKAAGAAVGAAVGGAAGTLFNPDRPIADPNIPGPIATIKSEIFGLKKRPNVPRLGLTFQQWAILDNIRARLRQNIRLARRGLVLKGPRRARNEKKILELEKEIDRLEEFRKDLPRNPKKFEESVRRSEKLLSESNR